MGQTNEKQTAEFHVVSQGKHTGRHDLIHFLKTRGAGIYQPENEATNFVQNSSGLGFCVFFSGDTVPFFWVKGCVVFIGLLRGVQGEGAP